MLSSGGVLVIMAMLTSGFPDKPDFKETTIICSQISAFYSKEGYPYVGIIVGEKYFLTIYKESAILIEQVAKECKNY